MNCRNFLKFDCWENGRFVWRGGGPDPLPLSATPPESAPAPPHELKDDADKRRKAAQKKAAGAREAGDEEAEKSGTTADAKLEAQISTPTIEQVNAAFEKYKENDSYKVFLEDLHNETAKKAFLDEIKDENDKKAIAWALTAEVTKEEKDAIVKELDKNFPIDSKDAGIRVAEGKLNYRQWLICSAILKETTEQSAIPEAVEKAGIIAVIEKFMEKLSQLVDKFGELLGGLAGGKEKQAASKPRESPLGKETKFKLKEGYQKGKGVAIEAAPNTPIYAVETGTITKADTTNNIIEITGPNNKWAVIYRNVIPDNSIQTGKTIERGAAIGKSGPQGFLTFQFIDEYKQEQDPTTRLLAGFIETPEQPAAQTAGTAPPETQAQKPAPKPAAGPEAKPEVKGVWEWLTGLFKSAIPPQQAQKPGPPPSPPASSEKKPS